MTAQAGSVSFSSMSHLRDLSRDALRREIRRQRRSLSLQDRTIAAKRFCTIAGRHRLFQPGMQVGLYLPFGHEADCHALMDLALARGCRVYVPRIVSYRHARMRFIEHGPALALIENKYGIAEPANRKGHYTSVLTLDAIVLPVIAVDHGGYRLGSGAGFYDRALQHLRRGRRWRKPKLIALAYDFQRIEHLPAQTWDVPVDAILTEKQLYRIPTAHHESHT
jgi:5-formyltetrahydrofolate cyclo-ligase